VFLRPGVKALLPLCLKLFAARAGVPQCVHVLRDVKGFVRPAQRLARGGDFGCTQGRAVHFLRSLHCRRALANDGAKTNQGGTRALAGVLARTHQGGVNRLRVVAVHVAHDVPAVTFKAPGGVVGKPGVYLAIDGNAVVVVAHDQFGQA